MKFDNEYKSWLVGLKSRIRQSQIKAAVKVNTELLRLYWDLGHDIVARRMEAAWGSGFFERLSGDLRREFPDMQGFSSTNLKYCKRFYAFYVQDASIRQQVADEIHPQLGGRAQSIDNSGDTNPQHVVGEIRPLVVDDLGSHPIFQIPKKSDRRTHNRDDYLQNKGQR